MIFYYDVSVKHWYKMFLPSFTDKDETSKDFLQTNMDYTTIESFL